MAMNQFDIFLPGLVGSNPLGALAAFGLLKVISLSDQQARLSFMQQDDWVAVLQSKFTDEATLVSHLVDYLKERPRDDLEWSPEDVRVPSEVYRNALRSALDSNPTLVDSLQSIAADGAVDKSKGLIKPTDFFMVSGQQSFLGILRAVREAVVKSGEPAWREALIGPWRYLTPLHSLGWDPAGERLHALRARAPTKEKPSCVAAAVWLAFEAMTLFPALSRHGRQQTTGFNRMGFRWPLTSTPINLATLGVLVASRLQPDAPRKGIAAIYESERFTFGQGYAVFRPASRLF